MTEKIHIGKLIQQKMKEDGRKASWLAEKINCNRNNIYNIYKRQSIDTNTLIRICIILNVNMFSCYFEFINEQIQR